MSDFKTSETLEGIINASSQLTGIWQRLQDAIETVLEYEIYAGHADIYVFRSISHYKRDHSPHIIVDSQGDCYLVEISGNMTLTPTLSIRNTLDLQKLGWRVPESKEPVWVDGEYVGPNLSVSREYTVGYPLRWIANDIVVALRRAYKVRGGDIFLFSPRQDVCDALDEMKVLKRLEPTEKNPRALLYALNDRGAKEATDSNNS